SPHPESPPGESQALPLFVDAPVSEGAELFPDVPKDQETYADFRSLSLRVAELVFPAPNAPDESALPRVRVGPERLLPLANAESGVDWTRFRDRKVVAYVPA